LSLQDAFLPFHALTTANSFDGTEFGPLNSPFNGKPGELVELSTYHR
jgi:hypothetical protein